jgi:hypothetical protein
MGVVAAVELQSILKFLDVFISPQRMIVIASPMMHKILCIVGQTGSGVGEVRQGTTELVP